MKPDKYKNIVFDLGNVLICYDSTSSTRVYTDDEQIIKEIDNILYKSTEWVFLDAGWITEEEAMKMWLPRFSSDKVREIAQLSFRDWTKYNLKTNEGSPELIRELKSSGKKLYVLSNISARFRNYYKEYVPEWQLFDGIFFSAEHYCIKPSEEIFMKFYKEFGLTPSECLFIDDNPQNVEEARKTGMDSYLLSDRSIQTLKTFLSE